METAVQYCRYRSRFNSTVGIVLCSTSTRILLYGTVLVGEGTRGVTVLLSIDGTVRFPVKSETFVYNLYIAICNLALLTQLKQVLHC